MLLESQMNSLATQEREIKTAQICLLPAPLAPRSSITEPAIHALCSIAATAKVGSAGQSEHSLLLRQ